MHVMLSKHGLLEGAVLLQNSSCAKHDCLAKVRCDTEEVIAVMHSSEQVRVFDKCCSA